MEKTNPTKLKSKSLIRWEALVPASLILGLIIAYFILFFDTHFRRGIETAGYALLGAEVNVASLKTSFIKGSLSIRGLEFTDADKPSHNVISIGDINFDASWDALLRGKILIELAAIEQIQFDAPRSRRGRVKPPDVESKKPSLLEKEGQKLATEALDKTKETYGENVLGDIANLLSGGSAKEQMANLESRMKSKALMTEIEKDFTAKKDQWNQRLQSLPQQKDLNDWQQRFKNIKTQNFSSPQELQQSLNELQNLLKEAEDRFKTIESSRQALTTDMKTLDNQMKDLEKSIQTDIKTLESHFKLPQLDARAITNSLFQRYAGPYLSLVNKYQAMANKYLPPGLLDKNKEEKEDLSMQPRPRERGLTYEFGKPNGYPFFWLKKARLSSKATPGVPSLGNMDGEAINITSNQVLIGRPTEIKFRGDFPELAIDGVAAEIIINHTKRPFRESFSAKVASYPSDKKMLVSSDDLQLGFNKAIASAAISASYTEGIIDFSLNNSFSQLERVVTASNKEIDSILKNIMEGIPSWTIEAQGSGPLKDLPIEIKSNLGGELALGFERVLKEKIAETQAKIKKLVDEAILKEKTKLESELKKARTQAEGELEKLKQAISKQKLELQARVEQIKKEEEAKAKKQLESEVQKRLGPDATKKLEDLKKKIKF